MTKSEKIQELSALWGECLCGYHKDKDTKHYINIRYCFGDVRYFVEHFGYVFSEYERDFHTLPAAQDYLISKLEEQITEECNNQLLRHADSTSWDVYDLNKNPKYWKNILVKLEKLKNSPTNEIKEKIDEEDYWITGAPKKI